MESACCGCHGNCPARPLQVQRSPSSVAAVSESAGAIGLVAGTPAVANNWESTGHRAACDHDHHDFMYLSIPTLDRGGPIRPPGGRWRCQPVRRPLDASACTSCTDAEFYQQRDVCVVTVRSDGGDALTCWGKPPSRSGIMFTILSTSRLGALRRPVACEGTPRRRCLRQPFNASRSS